MALNDIPDINTARYAFWGDSAAELATLTAARTAGITAATLIGSAPYATRIAGTAAAVAPVPAANIADWGVAPWKSSIGAVYTSGQPYIRNTVIPLTAADVRKIVIVNLDSSTKFMATILSVDGGVATLDANFPSSAPSQRMTWGLDQTTLINNAMAELAATASDTASSPPTRELLFGHGIYRFTQLVIPNGLMSRGQGWGNYGIADGSSRWLANTLLKQLPGANKDGIVFTEALPTGLGYGYTGPFELRDLNVEGPETNVTGHAVTSGSGIAMKTVAGVDLIAQDGTILHNIHSGHFHDDGFYLPLGCPLTVSRCRAFYNGRYGANCPSHNAQAVHMLDFSGDGNSDGLLYVHGLPRWSSLTITNLKSEMGNLQSTAGSGVQQHAIILDDCRGPVTINGLTHVSSMLSPGESAVFVAPGAAIKIVATTNADVPMLEWSAVGVRNHNDADVGGTEAAGVDGTPGPVLVDATNHVTVPNNVTRGTYGPPMAWVDDPSADLYTRSTCR